MKVGALIAASSLAIATVSCATDGESDEPVSGELTVFAAASLAHAFDDLADVFTAEHADVEVTLNVTGSQRLAGQIIEGAPADIFASASERHMQTVTAVGLADVEPQVFANNRLEIAVEPGNPRGITRLTDLARNDLIVVLAAPEVPAGEYTAEALDAASVKVSPASLETDVSAVASKVALGEADAGMVYHSDVVAAGDDITGVTIPAGENVSASYPIVTLVDAPNPDAARAFVAFVLSDAGQEILHAAGFSRP